MPRHSKETIAHVCDLYAQGWSQARTGRLLGLTRATVAGIIYRHGESRTSGRRARAIPESYSSYVSDREHDWLKSTAARLAWLYGSQDRSTAQAADLDAWNRLGREKAAA